MNPVEAKGSGTLPLSDVTVVDLTQVLAGPFATMELGDLGASVIKIEAVGRGDRSRSIEPTPEYFDTLNRNKRSIAIDLKSAEGQAVAHDLVADADVFIESTKPGRIETFGLDYATVTDLNTDIVYCSVTGFGSDSPYEELPAWDMLIQAMSGIMSMTGERDGPPLWSGLPSGDLAAGMYAAQSILAALYAQSTGQVNGEWIEVPMFDAAVSWLSSRAGYAFGFDEPFPRLGTQHPSVAPFGVFDCADEPIVIAAGTDSLWENMCDALNRPDLLADDRFASTEARVENSETLRNELEAELAKTTASEATSVLQSHAVPAGPIYDTVTVWDDPHIEQRDLRRTMDRPDREDAEVIDHPVHFVNMMSDLRTPPESVGESTAAILADQGYDKDEIDRLRDENVIS
jgi:crotonobetainyl-CoA:carnitine CoA-transferase CaiB-like acyl-CoA transferase